MARQRTDVIPPQALPTEIDALVGEREGHIPFSTFDS